jgi:hypothetical protein
MLVARTFVGADPSDMQGYSHLLMGQRFVARLDAGALGIVTRNFDF